MNEPCGQAFVAQGVREITGWSGLWLRIGGPHSTQVIDNMLDRPLRQTTD